MTQGFYEQLGVEPGASTADIRAAYARVVGALQRRQRALIEQGGDPGPLEVARAEADEAWRVLSDPSRRRRYDAMRVVATGEVIADDALWARVAGALVPPAVSIAAELLRTSSGLAVGRLPAAPRPPSGAARPAPAPFDPASERVYTPADGPDTEIPTVTARADGRPMGADPGRTPVSAPRAAAPRPVPVTRLPGSPEPAGASVAGGAPLRVVDGAESTPVVVISPSGRPGSPRPSDVPPPVVPSLRVEPSARARRDGDSPGRARRDFEEADDPLTGATDPGQRSTGATARVIPSRLPRKSMAPEQLQRLQERLGWSGALLRQVREARGLSLQQLADVTRISERYLTALEDDDHDRLPSSAFVKGYLQSIAGPLGLDEDALVTGYLRRVARG